MPLSLFRSLARARRRGNLNPPAEWLRQQNREAEMLRWSVKVLGNDLVQRHYAAGLAGPGVALPQAPAPAGLTSRTCRQADIEGPWVRHWCRALGTTPFYHRKLWEDCYILQVLWEAGLLQPGRRALGFAVGEEPLPAILASHGVEVLATDIAAEDARAQDWIATGQHGRGTDRLFRPHLFPSRAAFDRLVSFRSADMAQLPEALLDGSRDLVWSACSMEHLGSHEAGLAFVETAMRCLRPGGIAVHTTEMNLDPAGPTLDRGSTVLFQRQHLEALEARLAARGHRMLPLDDTHPAGALDQFVDVAPFEEGRVPLGPITPPHLRLSIAGYPATSVGIVVVAGQQVP
ncbi:cyclopropane-fatty-acyl-phospholipid synthase family protein [Roseicella sp. DB1501]|uniref:SAM-dependent methyltransferase n=1 Tax=Roseicella sp. DB1501 TaxID=2730925 RepID=UPI00149314EF|nr:class I SAM-dependent methyltransferase [Roseicella sp. DB1501]NOG72849.1 class I SAM-dependent methyltransferase [Roseicella sp. DB1501]